MKFKVTPISSAEIDISEEKIVFRFVSFSVEIPKSENELGYYIGDISQTIGIPIFLVITPKIYKTSSWGKIKMVYNFVNQSMRIPLWMPSSPFKGYFSIPLTAYTLKIEGKNQITEFLTILGQNGYEVSEPLEIITASNPRIV